MEFEVGVWVESDDTDGWVGIGYDAVNGVVLGCEVVIE